MKFTFFFENVFYQTNIHFFSTIHETSSSFLAKPNYSSPILPTQRLTRLQNDCCFAHLAHRLSVSLMFFLSLLEASPSYSSSWRLQGSLLTRSTITGHNSSQKFLEPSIYGTPWRTWPFFVDCLWWKMSRFAEAGSVAFLEYPI